MDLGINSPKAAEEKEYKIIIETDISLWKYITLLRFNKVKVNALIYL